MIARSRALVLAVVCAGCADLAGLDDLRVDAAAMDSTSDVAVADSKPDVASACDAAETGAACSEGMIAVPGGCYFVPLDPKVAVVQPFCVDPTEVTLADYRACAEAGECPKLETIVTRHAGDSDTAWAAYNSSCNA